MLGQSPYPGEALRLHQEGTTTLTLHVNANGRVTRCLVATSSGSPSLDRASCAFAHGVRFDPARDGAGVTVEGDTSFPMHWRLPRD